MIHDLPCLRLLSAAHRNCLASLARGNMLFLQVILFPKPWRYF